MGSCNFVLFNQILLIFIHNLPTSPAAIAWSPILIHSLKCSRILACQGCVGRLSSRLLRYRQIFCQLKHFLTLPCIIAVSGFILWRNLSLFKSLKSNLPIWPFSRHWRRLIPWKHWNVVFHWWWWTIDFCCFEFRIFIIIYASHLSYFEISLVIL